MKISSDDIRAIFGNIEDIIELHRLLHIELENHHKQWPDIIGVGETFLMVANQFKAYEYYVLNLKYAIDTIHRLTNENPHVAEIIQKVVHLFLHFVLLFWSFPKTRRDSFFVVGLLGGQRK
jgi:hypothetical protein